MKFLDLFEADPFWDKLNFQALDDEDNFFMRSLHMLLKPLMGKKTFIDFVGQDKDSAHVKTVKASKRADLIAAYREGLASAIQGKEPWTQEYDLDLNGLDLDALAKRAHTELIKANKVPVASDYYKLHPASWRKDGTPEDLKKVLLKPVDLLAQNGKMVKTGGSKAFNYAVYQTTLPAWSGLFYDKSDDVFKVLTTCPGAGKCALKCYVGSGQFIQYPGAYLRQAQLLTYLMNSPQKWKGQLVGEIIKASANPRVVKDGEVFEREQLAIRWHDSGDIFSEEYMDIMFQVMEMTPDVLHYAYTKSFPLLSGKTLPDNFVLNLSYGGVHDKSIQAGAKISTIVPKELFEPFKIGKARNHIDPARVRDFKAAIVEAAQRPHPDMGDLTKWDINMDNLLMFDELQAAPVDESFPKHCIITTEDGDDPAMRPDVQVTLLLVH